MIKEKVNVNGIGALEIYLIKIPNIGQVGQIDHNGLVLDKEKQDYYVFYVEFSFNKTFMHCEWDAEEKKHYNHGTVIDKKDSILKINWLFSI